MDFRKIVFQYDYEGAREFTQASLWSCLKKVPWCTDKDPVYNDDCLYIGSVEWVEKVLNISPTPDYFPSWASRFHKPVYRAETVENIESFPCFLKPADRYKRFNSKGFYSKKQVDVDGPFIVCDLLEGSFISEWRYYILNGEVVASEWYKGLDDNDELEPPDLEVNIPDNYCGAVDFGIPYYNQKLVLIEAHHPYACGWYGDYKNIEKYLKWAWEGQKLLKGRRKL